MSYMEALSTKPASDPQPSKDVKYIKEMKTFQDLLDYNMRWYRDPSSINEVIGQSISRDKDGKIVTEPRLTEILELHKLGLLVSFIEDGFTNDHSIGRAAVTGYIANDVVENIYVRLNRLGFICVYTNLSSYETSHITAYLRSRVLTGMYNGTTHSWNGLIAYTEGLKKLSDDLYSNIKANYSMIAFTDPTFGRSGYGPDGMFMQLLQALRDVRDKS